MVPFWQTFWTYSKWALEFLYVPPFVFGTLILGGILGASIVSQKSTGREIWRRNSRILIGIALVQVLLFPALITVGVMGAISHLATPKPWAVRSLDALLIVSLLLAAYCIWRAKGLRWFAGSLMLLQFWVLLGASFIADMSVTGDWL